MQADTEAWYGKLQKARDLTTEAVKSAQHNDDPEAAAVYQAEAALREVESGNLQRARVYAHAALQLAPNRDVRAMSALTLARAGDTGPAQRLAADLDQAFPLDTLVQRYWLPTIRAAISLQHNAPKRAIEQLMGLNEIELGQPAQANVYLCPVYLRGLAYLMLHDGASAASEFQKFISHRGLVGNFPWGAFARLGLARAYALERDIARSQGEYQQFLALWKNADSDVPMLRKAKYEFAKLR